MTQDKQFGKRLAEARQVAGMTQATLARKSGLTQHWISHYECGRRAPSLAKLIQLVKALDVTADRLLGI